MVWVERRGQQTCRVAYARFLMSSDIIFEAIDYHHHPLYIQGLEEGTILICDGCETEWHMG